MRRRVSVDNLKIIPFLPTLAVSEDELMTNSFNSDSSVMAIIIPFNKLVKNHEGEIYYLSVLTFGS